MISIQNLEIILPESSAVDLFVHWDMKQKMKQNEKPGKCMKLNIN